MEANVFKARISEAFKNKEFIKIIFQYPASDRAIIKRGIVLDIFENGFEFDEVKDGECSYSYDFIVEIKEEERLKWFTLDTARNVTRLMT